MFHNFEDDIIQLYNEEKWEDIVKLIQSDETVQKNTFCWVTLNSSDSSWINGITRQHNKSGIVSIGCGCGLMEWLLQKCSGLDIRGIEIDSSWWHSKYAPPLFLKDIMFVGESQVEIDILDKYALLFCYFNNGTAFCNYLENYRGNLIFVIGPMEGQQRSTDPLPFDAKFKKYKWELFAKKEIKYTKDYICAYVR